MRFIPVAIVFLAISTQGLSAQAKRAPAPEVKPVIIGGMQFSHSVEKLACEDVKASEEGCGDRVFVVAKKMKSKNKVGEEVWKTEVYQAVFDRTMESDVQAILPKSLKAKAKNIELIDEHGGKYTVSRVDGKLITPKEPKVYSGP